MPTPLRGREDSTWQPKNFSTTKHEFHCWWPMVILANFHIGDPPAWEGGKISRDNLKLSPLLNINFIVDDWNTTTTEHLWILHKIVKISHISITRNHIGKFQRRKPTPIKGREDSKWQLENFSITKHGFHCWYLVGVILANFHVPREEGNVGIC